MQYTEWCPTGFKVGLNDILPETLDDDDIAGCERSIVVMGNNTCISRLFSERICGKYDLLMPQEHLYIGMKMKEWKGVNFMRQGKI